MKRGKSAAISSEQGENEGRKTRGDKQETLSREL
jgi:hypothetical protein